MNQTSRRLCRNTLPILGRRAFLQQSANGFGSLALGALLSQWAGSSDAVAAEAAKKYVSPTAPKAPQFTARAKRVIFLFMEGGPSHIDTFDWKPELAKLGASGKSRPLAPVFPFKPHGNSGLMLADGLFPHLAKHADNLCLLNGVTTKTPSHHQGIVSLHTGSENFVRPSLGSWITYGLGTESEDLPGFITIDPISHNGGAQNYGSAFLPATFQGTRLGSGSGGVPNIRNNHMLGDDQRRQLDFVQQMNRKLLAQTPGQAELEGVIESSELAFRMQTSVPQTFDTSDEPQHIRDLYGIEDGTTERFGQACLMARRLAEKGVRFIQLTSAGWDHHNNLRSGLQGRWDAIDRPIAGLITDLKQRGLLKDTLILWGGEFGRSTADDKGNGDGRGHQAKGFTMWMAGAGVKGGFRYGATDELGGTAVEGRMNIHDLHATILHLLGLDHEALTYRYAGRDFRLTETGGVVARGILA
jgi:hypothetical protein